MRRFPCFLLIVGFAFFSKLHAQTISLAVKNAPLETVMSQLEQQSGFFFTYTRKQIEGSVPVTVSLSRVSLVMALDSVFRNQPLIYEIIGTSIILKERPPQRPPPPDTIANPKLIESFKGLVTDRQTGAPLYSASIEISGTGKGTFTDANGVFVLKNLPVPSQMEVSYIGYVTRKITINGQSGYLSIPLNPDSSFLQSTVINTGLYRRPVGNFTGSATQFTGSELKSANPTNVLRAISMLDPSMRITESYALGSDPNKLPVLQMRGQNNLPLSTQGAELNSINMPVSSGDIMAGYIANPNEPIFILDGFQTTLQTLYDLDINRIEKVTLLKDASATVAYGSRAANGVVVIETKRPVVGQMVVNYSANLNLQWAELNAYHLMNAEELLEAQRLAGVYTDTINHANNIALGQWYDYRLYQAKSGVNTDWLNQPVKTGAGLGQSLSVSGGQRQVRYGLYMNYNRVNGSLVGSSRTNFSLNGRLGFTAKDLRVSNSMTVYGNKSENSNYGPFSAYAAQFPYFRPTDSVGEIKTILEPSANQLGIPITAPGGVFPNPLNDATLGSVNYSTYQLFTNSTRLEWMGWENLRLMAAFHLYKQIPEAEYFLSAAHSFFSTGVGPNITNQGLYTQTRGGNDMYEGRLSFEYNKRLHNKTLYVSGGMSAQQTKSNATSITVTGLPTDYLPQLGAAAGFGTNVKPSAGNSRTRSISFYGSGSLNIKNLYSFEVTANASGSSQFGADNRLAPFGAAGLGWNLHNESFFPWKAQISKLRLLATYGITGNQNFAAFLAQPIYQYNLQNNYRLQTGATLQGFANPNLKWQQTNKTNLALELALPNDRVNLRFDYYIENTGNLILPIGVAPSTGFVSYQDNLGRVRNTGFELNLDLKILEQKNNNIVWTVLLNAGHYRNKILSLSPAIEALNNGNNGGAVDQKIPQPRFEVGESMSRIWAVPSLGIDPATGNELYRKKDGTTTFIWDPMDKVPAGEVFSKVKGTWGTAVSYKNLFFNALFAFNLGGQIYNQTLADKVENVDLRKTNADSRVLSDRWQKPGDQVAFKSIRLNNVATNATTRFVQDNNYLEAASLSLSWYFPEHWKWTKYARMISPRIYITHNNAFRISSVKIERGTDYPFSRSLNIGFSTSF